MLKKGLYMTLTCFIALILSKSAFLKRTESICEFIPPLHTDNFFTTTTNSCSLGEKMFLTHFKSDYELIKSITLTIIQKDPKKLQNHSSNISYLNEMFPLVTYKETFKCPKTFKKNPITLKNRVSMVLISKEEINELFDNQIKKYLNKKEKSVKILRKGDRRPCNQKSNMSNKTKLKIKVSTQIFGESCFHFLMHNKVLPFDTDNLKIKEFFSSFLSDISEETFVDFNKSLKRLNRITKPSFLLRRNNRIKLTKLNCYSRLGIINYITNLEMKFFLRLISIYKLLNPIKDIRLNRIINLNDKCKEYVQFIDFFNDYLDDKLLEEKLENLETTKKLTNEHSFSEIMKIYIDEFETIMKARFSKIEVLFKTEYHHYSRSVQKFFLVKNSPSELKKKFKIWFCDLFNDSKNFILFLLIPEIKLFLKQIDSFYSINTEYKRLHCFFSLLIFKINFKTPFIIKELKFNARKTKFRLTDCYIINLMVLEIRIFLCFIGVFFLDEERAIEILYLKAFMSFLRLRNPEVIKYFLFNEYDDLRNFLEQKELIYFFEYFILKKCTEIKIMSKAILPCKIRNISSHICDENYKNLNYTERVFKINENYKDDSSKEINELYIHSERIEEVTKILLLIFK